MDPSILFISLFKEWTNFYNSGYFLAIKIILGIYVLVVFVDIVLLLFQRGLGIDIRNTIIGMDIPKELVSKKAKFKQKWEKIKVRILSDNPSEYKVAVIEADNMIDDIVGKLGYKGESLAEKLGNIPEGHLEHLDEIRDSHDIRNKIIHDEEFVLTREEAVRVIKNFEKLLYYLQVLD